jgi:hypothetical protein
MQRLLIEMDENKLIVSIAEFLGTPATRRLGLTMAAQKTKELNGAAPE